MAKKDDEAKARTISWILRLSIAVLWITVGLSKFIGGPGNFVHAMQDLFAPSHFPRWIVTAGSWALPFVELALGVWLLFGRRLKSAWFFAGLYMICAGFGMLVAGQTESALLAFLLLFFPIFGFRVLHADRAANAG